MEQKGKKQNQSFFPFPEYNSFI